MSLARAAVAAAAPACSEALAPLPSAARAPQDAINTRWRILPADQRDGIKGYVVAKLIAISNSDESYRANKLFIGKMNKVLVQILKQEWPHNWPNFIQDICGASQTSEARAPLRARRRRRARRRARRATRRARRAGAMREQHDDPAAALGGRV